MQLFLEFRCFQFSVAHGTELKGGLAANSVFYLLFVLISVIENGQASNHRASKWVLQQFFTNKARDRN